MRGGARTQQQRRKWDLKARLESGLPYFSSKRIVPGAFNKGLIGSTCTALPRMSGRKGTDGRTCAAAAMRCCAITESSTSTSHQGLTLAHFTAQLKDLRDSSLTLELNLSTLGTHPRVNLGQMGDRVRLS